MTLSDRLAEFLRTRVATGRYGTESDVVSDGLLELMDRDEEIGEEAEQWLRTEGAAAYDAWKADPSKTSSLQEVKARLRAMNAGEDVVTGSSGKLS